LLANPSVVFAVHGKLIGGGASGRVDHLATERVQQFQGPLSLPIEIAASGGPGRGQVVVVRMSALRNGTGGWQRDQQGDGEWRRKSYGRRQNRILPMRMSLYITQSPAKE